MVQKKYSKKKASQFNWFRAMWQVIVCKIIYMIRFILIYRVEIHGFENIPKDNRYIVCPNHLSTLDPPLIAGIMPRRVAFMAKKELFAIPLLRWWLGWLGTFAVDREKLGPSTVKTAEAVHDSKWILGIFPQGTRGLPGEIKGVTKGFAGLAKLTKCNILPVGITGSQEVKWLPFSGKIVVNIGKIIPYEKDLNSIKDKWIKSIGELTGFKYIEDSAEENGGKE